MNAQVFEVKHYMVILRQLEVRDYDGVQVRIRGMVRCLGDEYSMDVVFVDDWESVPAPIINEAEKKGTMFMPAQDMLTVVDILRNEKPIYAHLRGDRPEWTSITTTQEPVGEGEISS